MEPESTSQDPEAEDPFEFKVFWKDGLNFQTLNKEIKMKIGGRIHNDWAWFSVSDDLGEPADGGFDFEDGTQFRRARIKVEGELQDGVEFKAEYDFAGGSANFRDVYMGFKETPVGGLRIGQFKEPLSLEQLTSANYITFIERSSVDALAPARSTGGMLHEAVGEEERFNWAVGVFRDSNNFGDQSGDGEYALTGRLAGAPVYGDDGRRLVHVGGGVSYRSPVDDMISISVRPEVNLAPQILTTGVIDADKALIYNAEFAWVGGPVSAQAEYTIEDISAETGSDPMLQGYYAFLSYFVTGENRVYKKAGAAFDKVTPKRSFGEEGGFGAVELGVRYSHLEFEDVPDGDDELTGITAGVNWYLYSNMRIMANYNLAELDEIDGEMNALNVRFQIFF